MAKYIIHAGDTLNAVAARFTVAAPALLAANPQIVNPDRIFPGQIVTIPGPAPAAGPEYVIQPGDTLSAVAARFGVTLAALEAANPQIVNPDRIFPGQIVTTTAATKMYVRQNIWTLHDADPWHPVIHAYARGVAVLRQRSAVDPLDPLGWQYQSDIHGTPENPDDFRNQCQHFCWFFLPWHRMYLEWFERIVRAAIQDLDDVDDETKQTWALPYWNYSSDQAARRALPKAFLDPTLPDGVTPNPLRVPGRTINNGSSLAPVDVELSAALAPVEFAGPAGFAGGRTGFSHGGEDPGSVMGPLEGTPHGSVHVQVGGLMGSFDTAALDPIFWLHHANIDRLWEVWRTMAGRANTTEPAWLSGVTFHFHDEHGAPLGEQVHQVLETADLHYRYEDISAPVGMEVAMAPGPEPAGPPELAGASVNAVTLAGATAQVTFEVSAPVGPLADLGAPPAQVYLRLEDVTADGPAGVTYRVYLTVPDGDPATDDAHYVGLAAFFGVEQTRNPDNEHGGLRLGFDITDLYRRLQAEQRWNDRVSVTFVAQYVVPAERPVPLPSGEVAAAQQAGEVRVGRVSIFVR